MGRCRRAAGKAVRALGDGADALLVTAVYVAADNVDRAEASKAGPGQVAYVNAELRAAHRQLRESLPQGGGETVDPFADLDAWLRPAQVGNSAD